MATEKYEKKDGWDTKLIEKLTGGIDYSVRSDGLKDEQATIASNVIFYNDQVRVDTGYDKFVQTVVGIPRAVYQLYYKDGSSELLLVTNTTLYKLAASEWQYVSGGVD